MKRLRYLPLLPVLVFGLISASPAAPPAAFLQGVASGDVTSSSVILWTRADQAGLLTLEVSTNNNFSQIAATQNLNATAATDFTVKATITGLSPATTYFYRFKAGNRKSPVGQFRTAPLPETPTTVRFAWSSDSDGSKVPKPFNNFQVLDRAGQDNIDFFVYLGDTAYMDTFGGKAEFLDEMRAKYKQNRRVPALRNLLAATAIYAIWDDHEVEDNFDGLTVDEGLFANGRQAFQEYMPIQTWDSATGFFRTFRWGKDLELFILDERSFRSGSVEATCANDLLPTAPASIRLQLGLPPAPPAGCLAALADGNRTMLGGDQKDLLAIALDESDATWKVIVNEVPITELFALPYDRWEGYVAERLEILNLISNMNNVVFLTGDLHANIIADVRSNLFTNPTPITKEFIAGPIAQATLLEQIVDLVGSENASAFIDLLTTLASPDCFNLNTFAYGLVEIDVNTNLIVTLKDKDGNTLMAPNGVSSCTITLAP